MAPVTHSRGVTKQENEKEREEPRPSTGHHPTVIIWKSHSCQAFGRRQAVRRRPQPNLFAPLLRRLNTPKLRLPWRDRVYPERLACRPKSPGDFDWVLVLPPALPSIPRHAFGSCRTKRMYCSSPDLNASNVGLPFTAAKACNALLRNRGARF